MSREKNLKRLKASLEETQDILGELVTGTSKDANKRLHKANRRLQNTYDDASSELEALVQDTSKDVQKQYFSAKKDVQKQYASTKKDLDKQAAKAKSQLVNRFADTTAAAKAAKASLGAGAVALAAKADLPSRAANAASFLAKTGLAAKAVELATKANLKSRTSNLLEGAAGGFVAARNRLNPDEKLIIRSEKDKHNVTKAGYFIRFSALAIIIISKRHKLMELGTQLYDKLKDSEGRASITQDARDQFDTMRRLMKAYSNGQYREFPYRSLVKIVAAVIYFVSVADLIPDFIPVLGLTDDLAILAWVFSSVKDDLQQFVDWEAAEEKRRTRLASKSESNNNQSQGASATTGSVANVGNASAPDRKASPNVTTTVGSDTGSKASVTTGTSGTAGSTTTSGSSGTTTGSTGTGSTGTTSGSSSTGSSNSGSSRTSTGGSMGGSTSGSQGGNKQS